MAINNVKVLQSAKLHHSQLNSFLIEYEARMAGLDSVRLSPFVVKIYSKQTGRSAAFRRAAGPGVSRAANIIAMNKLYTKRLWEADGIPNNPYVALSSKEYNIALCFSEEHNWNIVMKPTGGFGGKNVYTDIRDEKEFREYWEILTSSIKGSKRKEKNILVERKFPVSDYRFFVVGRKVVAVQNRVPSNIIGDGVNNIGELIKIKQIERMENPDLFSRPMKVDAIVDHNLAAMSYSYDTVLEVNEKVVLRNNANLSTGGENIDVTDKIPAKVKRLVEKAVSSIPNLRCSAIDVLAKNIYNGDDLSHNNIVMNEIESDPGMCIHHFPVYGKPRNVAAMIIADHFGDSVKATTNKRIKNYQHDFDEHEDLCKDILSTM